MGCPFTKLNQGYPKIIMDILNYLRISKNELWISINEYRISINAFKDILKNIFGYIRKSC